MVYAIWNLATGNREGWYQSEGEAFADVRDAAMRFGQEHVRTWALARHQGDDVVAIAEGDELIDRAFGVTSTRHPTT